MIRYRLSEEDAARYGLPPAEWLEYDERRIRLSEIRALKAATGAAPEDILRRGDEESIAAVVWLMLRRRGIDVPFAELDFDISGLETESVAGKAPAALIT